MRTLRPAPTLPCCCSPLAPAGLPAPPNGSDSLSSRRCDDTPIQASSPCSCALRKECYVLHQQPTHGGRVSCMLPP